MRSLPLRQACVVLLMWALALGSLHSVAQPAAQPVITVGTVNGQLPASDTATTTVFGNYLAGEIPDQRFNVRAFDTIEALVEAVDRGEIDYALITPVAYVQLSARHELRPLATVTQEIDGEMYPWLASAAFVREDSPLFEMPDARGQRVVALSPLALGGWLAALREWRQLGLDERRDFTSLEFDFSYQAVIQAVCEGRADIGVLPASMLQMNASSCAVPLRVLALPGAAPPADYPYPISSRLYPEVGFAQVKPHDERLVNQLTLALLSLRPRSATATAINVASFTAPLGYDSVTNLLQELQLPPFEDYGKVTLNQVVQQHGGKLVLLFAVLAGVLTLAYVRNFLLQRKVRQSELFRSQIFSRSEFGLIVLQVGTLAIVDVNRSAVRLLGAPSREALLSHSLLEVLASEQNDGMPADEMLAKVRQQLQSQEVPLVRDWLLRRADGETWEAEAHLVPFIYGAEHFIQLTLIDITERKRMRRERERMEQQLQHSQRLESIGRFSGTIAHDFNNLLTVINGYCELLLLNPGPDIDLRNIYKEISTACSRAGELTNQLLTFSRRRSARLEPVDLNRIIGDSVSMFRRLLGETVQLRTELSPDLGLTLADAGQLHQVLMNFVVNSRDAMPGGGELGITTESCRVGKSQARQLDVEPGDYVRLTVSDTGMGMSAEVQQKIFEPFFSTKGERGNGFGLATAYGIVRQCQGTITFRSELGIGTTFLLYLPVTRERAVLAPVEAARTAPPVVIDRTVLVVEDEREVRLFAALLLQRAGFRVLEAESATAALKLAEAHVGGIDLLFTDVVLGDLSGSRLAEQFKERHPATQVLFTSGYANDEMALHGLMQDRIAFIAKPYSPATLLTKIATLFEPTSGNA